MPSFDPATVRKAVEDFTPRRPQKFQDLLPAKDVITELRQKRAAYRSIADLLTQHCLPTSKTAIAVSRSAMERYDARFCRSEEHTSELQSQSNLVCRLLLE